MNSKLNVKSLIILIMPLFFHLLTNDHFQGDFLNKLYIKSIFNEISLPFLEIHLIEGWPWTALLNHKQLFDINQNLLSSNLKNKFSPTSIFFPMTCFSLHQTTKEFLVFIKATHSCFYHMCFIQVHWLAVF